MIELRQVEALAPLQTVNVHQSTGGILYGIRLSECRGMWTHYSGFEQNVKSDDMWSDNAFELERKKKYPLERRA